MNEEQHMERRLAWLKAQDNALLDLVAAGKTTPRELAEMASLIHAELKNPHFSAKPILKEYLNDR